MFNLVGLLLLVAAITLTVLEYRRYKGSAEWGSWLFVKISTVVWLFAAGLCAWLWARPINNIEALIEFFAMAIWGLLLGVGFGAVLGKKQGFGAGRGALLASSTLAFGASAVLLTLHDYFG